MFWLLDWNNHTRRGAVQVLKTYIWLTAGQLLVNCTLHVFGITLIIGLSIKLALLVLNHLLNH